ncbi:hypothetical protein [Rhizosphaericola mali]|uniref:Uncharacterized protein n=1 Tax=Rhizosphaericola mali TaxID=2545455 RepID=A0A5P2G5K5_9BACT|nr:hypothetical protein [Rhizosphaericola mali]QES90497.1 hypothetical protein E0W69_018155 [Rhizosphaericola mali]
MNTLDSGELNKPSKKKIPYPIENRLRDYLIKYGREVDLSISYDDLLHFTYALPIFDENGIDTHWEKVSYDLREWEYINDGLVKCYAILKTEGDLSFANHLEVAQIEFCGFGNSQPFRVRIINKYNANYDHFYVKKADASRIYGLELEHLLSPNRLNYFTNGQTLIEEHIPGIPGDIFVRDILPTMPNPLRFLKEFVKFNERCFVRLLGDMRSYNYVVEMPPDIDGVQYRIRAIDFDQQSYEGRKNMYLPQFFIENQQIVNMALEEFNQESLAQYQAEERARIVFRIITERYQIKELLDVMIHEKLAPQEKIDQLKVQLADHFKITSFLKAKTMGQIVKLQLKQNLRKSLMLVRGARHYITKNKAFTK